MRLACGALLLAAVAACDLIESEPVSNPGVCRQTYEFGNYGCARVGGRVLNASGQPVAGANVRLSVAQGTESRAGELGLAVSRADGRYEVESIRYSPPSGQTNPDTVTMYLSVGLPGQAGPAAPDSVPVVVHFSPVGALAIVVQRDIQIP